MMQQDENGIGNVNVNVLNINPSREDHSKRYWNDLCLIEQFHNRQSGGVVVGEWSLAGPTWSKEKNDKFTRWIVPRFMERSHGCLFWTWEADIPEWSFQKSESVFELDWEGLYAMSTTDITTTTTTTATLSKPQLLS